MIPQRFRSYIPTQHHQNTNTTKKHTELHKSLRTSKSTNIMLLTAILAIHGTLTFVLAVSFQPNTTDIGLERRATPKIGSVFSQQEIQQIRDGHADAIELAQSVIIMSQKNSKLYDKILAKHFNPADSSIVLGLYSFL